MGAYKHNKDYIIKKQSCQLFCNEYIDILAVSGYYRFKGVIKVNYKAYADDLIKFIDNSPCALWAQYNCVQMLKDNGFIKLDKKAESGGRYYIEQNGSAVAAFIKGNEDSPVRIGAAHLDSPAIMLKPKCEIVSEGLYVRLNSEIYGGAILSSWLDRPLGVAGRVMLQGETVMPEIRLYKSNRPLCIVPNCAPHLNREINSGYAYNKQKDMLPLFSLNPKESIIDTVAEDLKVNRENILDYELYCYETAPGTTVGNNRDMISIGRLDDLMMSYALIRAVCEVKTNNTAIVILTDNEEVGSLTQCGARGTLPLETVRMALGENYRAKLKNAVAFSADLAHAVNPSCPDLHEPLSRPHLNCGMVLKRAANKSYSTDGVSGAVFKHICKCADIPYQEFVNPSDRPGGTTIGPMISAALGIPTADIGAPIMAMHSVRELGGVKDAGDSLKLFKTFFEM